MSDHYILDGHKTVPVGAREWARWLEVNRANRHVADETIEGIRVSTAEEMHKRMCIAVAAAEDKSG